MRLLAQTRDSDRVSRATDALDRNMRIKRPMFFNSFGLNIVNEDGMMLCRVEIRYAASGSPSFSNLTVLFGYTLST